MAILHAGQQARVRERLLDRPRRRPGGPRQLRERRRLASRLRRLKGMDIPSNLATRLKGMDVLRNLANRRPALRIRAQLRPHAGPQPVVQGHHPGPHAVDHDRRLATRREDVQSKLYELISRQAPAATTSQAMGRNHFKGQSRRRDPATCTTVGRADMAPILRYFPTDVDGHPATTIVLKPSPGWLPPSPSSARKDPGGPEGGGVPSRHELRGSVRRITVT